MMIVRTLLQRRAWLFFSIVLLGSLMLASCSSSTGVAQKPTPTPTYTPTPTPTPTPSPTPTPIPTPTYPPPVPSSKVLGIVADANHPAGIPWVRLGYHTCVSNNVRGATLKDIVQKYHAMGVRVLLSVCQWAPDTRLYNTSMLNDAAQGGADAVQCGNEQMKYGLYNMYVDPGIFAKFFDLCQRAVHAVRPQIPVIIGSMDPQVGGIDYGPLYNQLDYLNSMEYAMNTSVHPGGSWHWRSQILGLIDSWHNGYPSQSTNSLYYLFAFWAQQIGVNLDSGALGNHLWVVEGTGCVFGCGVPGDSYDQAISHIMTLITDVQTSMRYKIPFFYFSTKDFYTSGQYWPMGIRDANDHPKPLRQDLWMGARTLAMSCSSGQVTVSSQEQLLAKMYAGCSLPDNFIGILES